MPSYDVEVYPATRTSADWAAPGNIGAADNNLTNKAWSAAETGDAQIFASGFNAGIPAVATIDAVVLEIRALRSGSDSPYTFKFGTGHGHDEASFALTQESAITPALGATVYSMNCTSLPSVAELNEASGSDAGLGVRVYALKTTTVLALTYLVDYVRLHVYYTLALAVLTTAATTSITQITASSGGNVTDDGAGTVSERGVCWNTTGSPTIADAHTSNGSGTGAFTSALTGLYPSFRYYVRAYATTEYGTGYGPEVTFDTLASSSRSLVARPFTTRAAAAEDVAWQGDGIIDWWIEDNVARAELRPTDVSFIPRSRWYVVSRDAPGASVSLVMDSEDTPDIVCVVYKAYGVTGVRDGTIRRVYYPAAPTSLIERVQLVDLTGQYMNDTDAASYAENVMLRADANAMAATITATGGLSTVDGHFRPAPLILAGDWIDVTDLPGHTPTYITGSTFAKATGVVTITTGGREQREPIIPGLSALPQALTVYGADTAYETYNDTQVDTTPYEDTGTGPGMTPPPGIKPPPGPISGPAYGEKLRRGLVSGPVYK